MSTLFKKKSTALLIHLLFSVIVIGCFLALVFLIWYPAPYYYAEGVEKVIIISLCVYLILGPIMTFILYKPEKKGLLTDLIIVVIIQSGAFYYGAQLVYYERPAYISFSYDQFKTIQASRIDAEVLKDQSLKSGIFTTPILVSVKLPRGPELLRIISDSTTGKGKNTFELAQYYQPFDKDFKSATRNTSGLLPEKLYKQYPEQSLIINQLKQKLDLKDDDLLLLPIQGSQNDVIVIINKLTGKAIKHLLITPWNLTSK